MKTVKNLLVKCVLSPEVSVTNDTELIRRFDQLELQTRRDALETFFSSSSLTLDQNKLECLTPKNNFGLVLYLRRRHDTKHSDTQHTDTQDTDTQHTDTQHTDTQHNDT